MSNASDAFYTTLTDRQKTTLNKVQFVCRWLILLERGFFIKVISMFTEKEQTDTVVDILIDRRHGFVTTKQRFQFLPNIHQILKPTLAFTQNFNICICLELIFFLSPTRVSTATTFL